MPPGLFSPAPLTPSNVIEINKSLAGGGGGGGGGLIEDFGTWLNTYVRSKFNNKVLVKYWIFFRCLDTLEIMVLLYTDYLWSKGVYVLETYFASAGDTENC